MASDRPVSLRLPNELIEQIDRRTQKDGNDRDRGLARAQATRGALNRYYDGCRRHLDLLGLSRGELAVICAALNGGMLGWTDRAHFVTAIPLELADAFAPPRGRGYGEQWGISDADGQLLVAKLARLSYFDLVAIADFAELFWADDPEANKTIDPDWQPAERRP